MQGDVDANGTDLRSFNSSKSCAAVFANKDW
jgi:hypothetical protein